MTTDCNLGPDRVLDVRTLPCTTKHGLILHTWQALPAGDHFILWNNHDPVRLREQFAVQWPGTFTWEHQSQAPEEVRIKITKLKPLGEPAVPVAMSCGGH